MNNIDFYVWIEDFRGNLYQFETTTDYEYAQYCGTQAMNDSREVRAWHITAVPNRPRIDRSNDQVPSSLARWHEFHSSSSD